MQLPTFETYVLMRAKCIVFLLALFLAFILQNRNSSAQEYFRELDTRPLVYSPVDYSVYNEPLYPTGYVGFAERDEVPDVETRPRFESTSYLEPAYPPSAAEEEKYNWAIGPFRFNIAAGLSLEYNDNVNLAPSGKKQSDSFSDRHLQSSPSGG